MPGNEIYDTWDIFHVFIWETAHRQCLEKRDPFKKHWRWSDKSSVGAKWYLFILVLGVAWHEQYWWCNSRCIWFCNRTVWLDWLCGDITSSSVFLAICREALISDRNPQAWSALLQFSGCQWIKKKKTFTNQTKWNARATWQNSSLWI